MRKPQYFIFNGINSLDVKKLYIVDTLPLPNLPARRVSKTQIPGRNGDLRELQQDEYGSDVYDSIEKTVKLCYKDDNIDFIKRWLRGTSKLLLSNQVDRYWRASIDNVISIETVIRKMRNFTIVFSCFPYAFLKSGDVPLAYTPTSTTWETILINNYDLSLPHLKIYGQGDIGMMVNGAETDFYSVDQYIECDSELQQCYKGTQNLGMNMSGEFPALYPGKNIIEFTGNIQKVIITPHWRAL